MPGIYMVMGDTAEVVAKRYDISRQAQDEYSLSSQQRTARAQAEGFFADEIAPMHVTRGAFSTRRPAKSPARKSIYVDQDECNRPDTTLEGLLALKPYFDPNSGQGTVTAGNASQLSDGASAAAARCRREQAERSGIKPQGRLSRLRGRRLRARRNGHRPGVRRPQAAARGTA